MKIVIIGAGISGCAMYLELQKHLLNFGSESHEIVIYEAYNTDVNTTADNRKEDVTHSSTLLVGGGLGIASNGLRVLQRLDDSLLRDVVSGGYAVSSSNLKSKNGSLLMTLKSSASGSPDSPGMNMVMSSRDTFWRCLRARVPDAHIINKRIEKIVAHPDGRNNIFFVDGSPSEEADLVIGADGVRSTAKRALFPDTKEDPYPPQYE